MVDALNGAKKADLAQATGRKRGWCAVDVDADGVLLAGGVRVEYGAELLVNEEDGSTPPTPPGDLLLGVQAVTTVVHSPAQVGQHLGFVLGLKRFGMEFHGDCTVVAIVD